MSDSTSTETGNAALSALGRFIDRLLDSKVRIPAQAPKSTPKREASKKPVEKAEHDEQDTVFSFSRPTGKRTILATRNKDNHPSVRINYGYRYVGKDRKFFQLIIHLAVMKPFKANRERKNFGKHIAEAAENNCVLHWADGVPSLHGRQPEGRNSSAGQSKRLGIGSRISNQKTKAIGIVGGFLKKTGASTDSGQTPVVFLLASGHVLKNSDGSASSPLILYPHEGDQARAVAVVEKVICPAVNTVCQADHGLAQLYPTVDYSPSGLGHLGELSGIFSIDELREADEFLVARVERPSSGSFKTAKFLGILEVQEFEVSKDEYAEIENVVILGWNAARFSKKGESGSLIVSVESRRAIGILIGSRKATLDKTANLSYASMMSIILSTNPGLQLELGT